MNQETHETALLGNKYIKWFMKYYNVDKDFILNNSYLFDEWIKCLDLCKDCEDLNHCKQKIKGRVKNLYVDGKFLEEKYEICKHKKKEMSDIHSNKNRRNTFVSTGRLVGKGKY